MQPSSSPPCKPSSDPPPPQNDQSFLRHQHVLTQGMSIGTPAGYQEPCTTSRRLHQRSPKPCFVMFAASNETDWLLGLKTTLAGAKILMTTGYLCQSSHLTQAKDATEDRRMEDRGPQPYYLTVCLPSRCDSITTLYG
jgi:hypothetical protein